MSGELTREHVQGLLERLDDPAEVWTAEVGSFRRRIFDEQGSEVAGRVHYDCIDLLAAAPDLARAYLVLLSDRDALRAQAQAVAGLREAVIERDAAWQALIVAEREWRVIPGASSMTDEEFDAADDASHAKYVPAKQRHQGAVKALEDQLAALAQASAPAEGPEAGA